MASRETHFEQLPADCTCGGYNLLLFREYPATGMMPELEAYRCEKCGHIEFIEANVPDEPEILPSSSR